MSIAASDASLSAISRSVLKIPSDPALALEKARAFIYAPDRYEEIKERSPRSADKYQALFEQLPDAEALDMVAFEQAEEARDAIVNALNSAFCDPDNSQPISKPNAVSSSSNVPCSVSQFEDLSVEEVMVAIQDILFRSRLAIQENLYSVLEIYKDLQKSETDQRMEKFREQAQAAREQQEKAHKAAVKNVVLDWVIGVGEIAFGALMVCTGMGAVSGATLIAAGIAGCVEAGFETAALVERDKGNIEQARKYEEYAASARTVREWCEIASIVAGFAGLLAEGIAAYSRVGKIVAQGVGEAARLGELEGVGQAFELVEIGGSEAATASAEMAEAVAKKSFEDMIKNIATKIMNQFKGAGIEEWNGISRRIQWHKLAAMSEQEMAEIVESSFSAGAKPAELATTISGKIVFAQIKATISGSMITNVIYSIPALLKYGQQMADGFIAKQIAESRALADKLDQEIKLMQQLSHTVTQRTIKEALAHLNRNAKALSDGLHMVLSGVIQVLQANRRMIIAF